MPRKATGTLDWAGDHYKARITLADGTRPWVHFAPGTSEAMAREKAAAASEKAKRERWSRLPAVDAAAGSAGETLATWTARWFAARDARGLTSVRGDRSRLGKHVLSTLGPKRMVDVTCDDVEGIVAELDAKVRAGALSWLTAMNVWAIVSKLFADACQAKDRALRVLATNPAAGVRGPDRGVAKGKAWLYPRELAKLVACEAVPLERRRLYALAVYTYARAGELDALTWEDVDLDHGLVHVHRAVDRSRGVDKGTKGGRARRFALEPNVVPMLRALRVGQGGAARVVSGVRASDASRWLHDDLRAAGVARAELFARDKTRKRITFHDLRGTAATWQAIRGDSPLAIKERLGHRDLATTEIYVRAAERVRGVDFGEVFPPLPPGLVESSGSIVPGGGSGGPAVSQLVEIVGAPGRDRTCDREIRNPPFGAVFEPFRGLAGGVSPPDEWPNPANRGRRDDSRDDCYPVIPYTDVAAYALAGALAPSDADARRWARLALAALEVAS